MHQHQRFAQRRADVIAEFERRRASAALSNGGPRNGTRLRRSSLS
jgi:hypothetical protein